MTKGEEVCKCEEYRPLRLSDAQCDDKMTRGDEDKGKQRLVKTHVNAKYLFFYSFFLLNI